jgi:hypothetical protein
MKICGPTDFCAGPGGDALCLPAMRHCRTVTGMYKLIKGLEEKRPEGAESASLFKAARIMPRTPRPSRRCR